MSKRSTAGNRSSTRPFAREWREQAQKVVAYPEDFGMSRRQVRSLARRLAQAQ